MAYNCPGCAKPVFFGGNAAEYIDGLSFVVAKEVSRY